MWDREVDLLVFGSGCGGMTAALVAANEGLDVLLCEKAGQLGGTTAISALMNERQCIGIDADQEYLAMAALRLAERGMQKKLAADW